MNGTAIIEEPRRRNFAWMRSLMSDVSGVPKWKRALDLLAITLTLPVWGPLMVLIAIGIKVSSPGPALFSQERVGLRGSRFVLFKFRSMRPNADPGAHEQYLVKLMHAEVPMTKLDAGDHRIFPFGHFLRASGLDELPQLFNVLRGEMSLVGPRPCTLYEFEEYNSLSTDRFKVAPGLTGHWQVNGKNRTTFTEMVAMDNYYAANVSLVLDLLIIFKTVPALVRQMVETKRNRAGAMKLPPLADAGQQPN